MHHYLLEFLKTHSFLGYIVVFVAMIFEGDILLFSAAFLTHQGFFNPVYMFLTVLTGVLGGDLLWYWVGLRLRERTGWITKWAKNIAEPFDNHLMFRTIRTIFLSKFIYGVHHAILIRSGMLKIELKKYCKIDFVTTIIWMVIVGGLGFISSISFDRIKHLLKFWGGTFLAVTLIFLILSYLISYEARKKL